MRCICGAVQTESSGGVVFFDFPDLKISFKGRVEEEAGLTDLKCQSVLATLDFLDLNPQFFRGGQRVVIKVDDPNVVDMFSGLGHIQNPEYQALLHKLSKANITFEIVSG